MRRKPPPEIASSSTEQGSTLVLALVILLVLTLIGVAGMNSTSQQEKMAGNLRDKDLAFQAAEAALREAEQFLQVASLPAFEGTDGLHQPDRTLWLHPATWAANSTVSVEYDVGVQGVALQPRTIIEELEPVQLDGESVKFGEMPDIAMFRATARGVGGTAGAEVILQTIIRR
ncbi:PilX N-terminal domain-containing pilus assembly protein [Desulfonatronum sp. SC1]|uniref:pilus assembly PilX family protein n=1 Tax=Desulfonatronum sp. SC1 TaxID=2109626 RepID=UPI000D2FB9E3|nr:pilus assembly protein [Desulfonatronum sp. SC1]PTN38087.1 hypothetical protein C6366_04280 [Desulfonatronum sp. SC1]